MSTFALRLVSPYAGLTLFGASIALMVKAGLGTLHYALAIGPLAHSFIPRLEVLPCCRQA
ncbi:hypothetical protein [Nonomuraea typhae]|uniref:Uncharacterized protein n=1 Tax=Nonomuraea typhae TaxID=2603600 RepID=A0ABW7Z6F3_9ACTN